MTAAPLLVALLATPLSAGMIENAGFEQNNGVNLFTHWNNVLTMDFNSVLPSAIRVDDGSMDPTLSGISPKFGTYQALLKNSNQEFIDPSAGYGLNVATDSAIESALLLPPGTLGTIAHTLGADAGPFAPFGSAIWQDFEAMANQQIRFCWNFLTHETEGTGKANPDFAFVTLIPVDSPPDSVLDAIDSEAIIVLASANQTLNDTNVGNYVRASSGEIILTLPGDLSPMTTYRLGFGVMSAKDAGLASALVLDGDPPPNDPPPVPEPSTILLMFAALICFIPFAVNRRKQLVANRL